MRVLLLLLVACSSSEPVSPDGGTSSPDGSSNDKRLYPLTVGRTWTYAVTSTYTNCPGGMKEMRVLSESMREGRPTFEVRGFCGLTGHTSVANDRVEEYYDWGPTGWMRSLDEPVQDGHTWTTTNGSATFGMRYSAEGADCWRVTQQVSYTTYWVYCRGKGLVRYEMVDLAGGTIKAELQ